MLSSEHKAEVLRSVPLFAACPKRELNRIAAIADEINFREGIILTRQGHPGREMFILLDGMVKVERNGVQVNQLGPGDFLGEGALILGEPRNATITATSPVRALVITAMNFKGLLQEDPEISRNVLETLGERTPPDSSSSP